MSDLTNRLLDSADDDPHETRRQAADRIEVLEAERASLIEAALDHRATASRALAREQDARAVIAEALADLNTYSENEFREIQHARVLRLRAILSRVPQGAAEPESQAQRRARRQVVADSGGLLGAAEPSDPQHADSGNAWGDDRPAEPWTDPEPWIDYVSRDRRPERPTGPDAGHYAKDPRSREQYDAEEGTRG